MKHELFAILICITNPALASEQGCSFLEINSFLKNDWKKVIAREGGDLKKIKTGIVARESRCPIREKSGMIEYMDHYQAVPIDDNSKAILIDTHQCGGGNKHGQYLIISSGEQCKIVTEPEIGDMAFLGKSLYVSDGKIILKGMKWLSDDPHCCPSKAGTLEYSVSSGKYIFNLHSIQQ